MKLRKLLSLCKESGKIWHLKSDVHLSVGDVIHLHRYVGSFPLSCQFVLLLCIVDSELERERAIKIYEYSREQLLFLVFFFEASSLSLLVIHVSVPEQKMMVFN